MNTIDYFTEDTLADELVGGLLKIRQSLSPKEATYRQSPDDLQSFRGLSSSSPQSPWGGLTSPSDREMDVLYNLADELAAAAELLENVTKSQSPSVDMSKSPDRLSRIPDGGYAVSEDVSCVLSPAAEGACIAHMTTVLTELREEEERGVKNQERTERTQRALRSQAQSLRSTIAASKFHLIHDFNNRMAM